MSIQQLKREADALSDAERRDLIGYLIARGTARMAALMTLVCLLEFSQLFIPGRQSEFQDVYTGWSGIFGAWLTAAVLGWHWQGAKRGGGWGKRLVSTPDFAYRDIEL